MPIQVLLVDDHTMFREALSLMLNQENEVHVVGELGNATELNATVERLKPDVVVMDISMPSVNGMVATRQLRAQFPQVQVVALSAFNYKKFVMEMMEAGAIAYVVKSAAGEQLLRAIQSAAQGKTFLCPEAAATLVEANHRHASGQTQVRENKRLARRETEVLRLLADGLSSPQIADKLHIATSTVDVHRRNIMKKLEIHSVAELTKYAIRVGLTTM